MSFSRRRGVAVYALLGGGFIAAILSIFAVWTARQLLDDKAWSDTSQELITNVAINTAVAAYLTEQLYENVDVKSKLEQVLPPALQPLAAPVAGAIQDPTEKLILRLLQRPRVQKLWAAAVVATHDQFIALVEDRGAAIRVPGGGAVELDLRPILSQAGDQLGLPITGERLPNAGRIVIMEANQLDTLQKLIKLLKAVAWVLFALAIALLALAVWLARGRRRQFTAAAALSLIGAAIVVLLARRLIAGGVVGSLADTASAQAAANAVYEIGTHLLANIARNVLMLGLVLLLGSWLSGPGRLATRVRGFARPALVAHPAFVHAGVVIVLLAILALGIIPGSRTAIGTLVLIAVTVVAVEMVRRTALAEAAPDGPSAAAPAAAT